MAANCDKNQSNVHSVWERKQLDINTELMNVNSDKLLGVIIDENLTGNLTLIKQPKPFVKTLTFWDKSENTLPIKL